jgi:hypothetical protein
MAPRLLSDLIPDPCYHFDMPVSFADKAALAVAFASAIASCSQAECWYGNVLTFLLGESPEVALAMLQEDRSTELQVKRINAAAGQRLQPDELMLFEAAMEVARAPTNRRHTLAHGLVGVCEELPDALLIADPRDFQLLVLKVFRNHRGLPAASKDEVRRASREFCKKVLVYQVDDLDEVTKEFEQSIGILMHLSVLCAPAHHAKADALRQLEAIREITLRVRSKKKSAKIVKSKPK